MENEFIGENVSITVLLAMGIATDNCGCSDIRYVNPEGNYMADVVAEIDTIINDPNDRNFCNWLPKLAKISAKKELYAALVLQAIHRLGNQTMTKQYISDEIGIDYGNFGNNSTWRIALVAPDNEILFIKNLGYSSSDSALLMALHEIKKVLSDTNLNGKDLFLMSPSQMLGLSRLKEWHNFRLAWGDKDPHATYSECNNGKELDWTFYFCSNGRNNVILTGSLPDEWWQWDDDKRYSHLQNLPTS